MTIASGNVNSTITWRLEDDGTMYIEGTGAMDDYSSSTGQPWYSNKSSIKSVVIGEGITSVGKVAFYEHTNIKSVSLASTVKIIGNSAFQLCENLTNVVFPDSMERIGNSAFNGCIIESPNIRNVKTIEDYAFAGYTTGHLSLVNVESIGQYVFSNSKIETMYMDNVTAETAYTMFGLDTISFLKSVELGNNQTIIPSGMFNSCEKLESIKLDKVKTIGNSAFAGCYVLKDISLDSVETIGQSAFAECFSIKKVIFPASLNSLGDYAFRDCYNCAYYEFKGSQPSTISTTCIGNWSNTSLNRFVLCKTTGWGSSSILGNYVKTTYTGWAGSNIRFTIDEDMVVTFTGTGKTYTNNSMATDYFSQLPIKRFIFGEGITEIGDNFLNTSINKGRYTVQFPESLTKIGDSAFYYCYPSSVIFPPNLKTISQYAFGNMHNSSNPNKNRIVVYRGRIPTLGIRAFGADDISSKDDAGGKTYVFSKCHAEDDSSYKINQVHPIMIRGIDGWDMLCFKN